MITEHAGAEGQIDRSKFLKGAGALGALGALAAFGATPAAAQNGDNDENNAGLTNRSIDEIIAGLRPLIPLLTGLISAICVFAAKDRRGKVLCVILETFLSAIEQAVDDAVEDMKTLRDEGPNAPGLPSPSGDMPGGIG
jgi:hypothetical protein